MAYSPEFTVYNNINALDICTRILLVVPYGTMNNKCHCIAKVSFANVINTYKTILRCQLYIFV